MYVTFWQSSLLTLRESCFLLRNDDGEGWWCSACLILTLLRRCFGGMSLFLMKAFWFHLGMSVVWRDLSYSTSQAVLAPVALNRAQYFTHQKIQKSQDHAITGWKARKTYGPVLCLKHPWQPHQGIFLVSACTCPGLGSSFFLPTLARRDF